MQIAVLVARFDAHQQAFNEFRDEVIARLDLKINGRLDVQARVQTEQAATLANLASQVKNLNHEVFERRREAPTPPKELTEVLVALQAIVNADKQPVTIGDVKKARAMVAAIWTLVVALAGAVGWIAAHWPKG